MIITVKRQYSDASHPNYRKLKRINRSDSFQKFLIHEFAPLGNDAKANTSSHFTWILYYQLSRSSPHPNTFRKLKSHTNDAVDAYHVKTSTWNNFIPEQNRVGTSIVKEQKHFLQ